MIRFFSTRLSQNGERRIRISPFITTTCTTSSHHHVRNLSSSSLAQSLALAYLQESCGLPLKSALSASKRVQIDFTEKADSVLNLLRSHGLTQTHIKDVIAKRPALLSADLDNTLKPNLKLFSSLGFSGTRLAKMLGKEPRVLKADVNNVVQFFRESGFSDEQIAKITMVRPSLYLQDAHRNVKPKLEFFKSLGLTEREVAKVFTRGPTVLSYSLENQIKPCIHLLRKIVRIDRNLLRVIERCPEILGYNCGKVLEPNMSVLRNHGVPESGITRYFTLHTRALLLSNCKFNKIVDEVKRLGFEPTTVLFVLAAICMAKMSKSSWDQKVKVYESLGLSKDEIYMAFKLQPSFMVASEEKIRKVMDFFVNRLKMSPSMISKYPDLLLLSMEKRIIPRSSVVHILMSKGLIRENIRLFSIYKMTEKMFVERLVRKYQDRVPQVVDAHQGKIEFEGFPRDLKM